MKFHIGFPKLCANETLLNEFYKDVSVHIPSSMEVWSDMRRVSDILWLQKISDPYIPAYPSLLYNIESNLQKSSLKFSGTRECSYICIYKAWAENRLHIRLQSQMLFDKRQRATPLRLHWISLIWQDSILQTVAIFYSL